MKLFPSVPIVDADLSASKVFRAQWQTSPSPIGKQLIALVPGVALADENGLPTKDFGLIWETSRVPTLDMRLPIINPDGTPYRTFILLCLEI